MQEPKHMWHVWLARSFVFCYSLLNRQKYILLTGTTPPFLPAQRHFSWISWRRISDDRHFALALCLARKRRIRSERKKKEKE